MNSKSLNKQISASLGRINETRGFLEASEKLFLEDLHNSINREPALLYLMLCSALFVGYKMHRQISTLQLIQLPSKLL